MYNFYNGLGYRISHYPVKAFKDNIVLDLKTIRSIVEMCGLFVLEYDGGTSSINVRANKR